jgi:gas vesicle protein
MADTTDTNLQATPRTAAGSHNEAGGPGSPVAVAVFDDRFTAREPASSPLKDIFIHRKKENAMRSSKTEDAVFLLGGALVGAAAMYLLDPELGARRRQRVAQAAGDSWECASDSLADGIDRVRSGASNLSSRLSHMSEDASDYASSSGRGIMDRARDVASSISGRASDLKDKISDYASDYVDRGSDWAKSARKAVSNAYGNAQDAAGDYSDSARSWANWGNKLFHRAKDAGYRSASRAGKQLRSAAGSDDGFGAGSVVGTAVGCCLCGAAAMYLFDPQRGRGRRAKLVDQTSSFVRRTGRSMRASGTDLANRMRGMMHEGRKQMGSAMQSSSELAQRIRAEISRCCSNPSDINFMADEEGAVTLTGPVDKVESDWLLAAITRIPGVCQIINGMKTRENVGNSAQASELNKQEAMPQM